MSYIYLENCHGIKNGQRIYLRKDGACFDFCNDIKLATNIPKNEVIDILKHADSYMSQYAADSIGIEKNFPLDEEALDKEALNYIRDKKTADFFIVSVHWYALGMLNHRHVFTSDYSEALAISKWYQDLYSNKWQFPHAVYIDEEATYEEW